MTLHLPDLVLFGVQGSGKGTQSQILAEKLGYTLFDTGRALRAIAAEDSELGHKVKELIDNGKLVPNEVIMEIVADFLAKTPADRPVIFDGTPRFEEQRQTFDAELARAGREPKALFVRLSEDEALRRLLGRITCGNCGAIWGAKDNLTTESPCPRCGQTALKVRADDTEEAIRNRLGWFARDTMPMIERYRDSGRLIEIDGAQAPEAVTNQILAELGVK